METTKSSTSSTVFAYVGSGPNVDVLKLSQEKGLFKKHGLDMAMLYYADESMSTRSVVSGTASAGTAPATDALKAISEGASMKIIMLNTDRFDHLFVARSGINGPQDLKSKKIAIARKGSFTDYSVRFLLRQWGIDPEKDVQFLELGNAPVRAAALCSGGVDATPMTLSFVPVAKKSGFNVLFDMSTTQTKFANRSVIASDRLIKERPQTVKAIVAGFIDGTRYWKANPDEAKAYLKKTHKLSDEETVTIYSQTSRLMRSEPAPDLDVIRNAWDNMPEIKSRGAVQLQNFVEASFVNQVLKELR